MTRNESWRPIHLRAVDKETAKETARAICPQVRTPETSEVIQTPRGISIDYLRSKLAPYIGRTLVAKPTHGTGNIFFLESFDEPELLSLFQYTRYNHFFSFRETQYYPLTSKVLIEESLGNVRDYKFFCARGQPLLLQVDCDRHINHKRVLLDLPSYQALPIRLGEFERPVTFALPDNIEHLCHIAAELSAPFDFVRVDLYEKNGIVFFSEFTFTPGAGLEPFSDPSFSQLLFKRIKETLSS